nr:MULTISPECIES: hypothetical protein [Nocardia]
MTACVVNDRLGGDILHTTATLPSGDAVSHYFNLIGGKPVDLTAEQFPEHTQFTRTGTENQGLRLNTRVLSLLRAH